MRWHLVRNPADPELDRLAQEYRLHPLHIEDCRHRRQAAKIEEDPNYVFIVLKPIRLTKEGGLDISDLDIFLGTDFLIIVEEGCEYVPLEEPQDHVAPDAYVYRLLDRLVDSYAPLVDHYKDRIDILGDEVLENPSPDTLKGILSARRCLVELRRILSNMRETVGALQRTRQPWFSSELAPFLRDVYDHLVRAIDSIDIQREVVISALEIYMSAVANNTNRVMKALTVLGTIALPALVISSFYGMNLEHLPWVRSPHSLGIVVLLMFASTAALLWWLRRARWL